MDKRALTERDICTKCITPALARAGWDVQTLIPEEVFLTKGRITVRGHHQRNLKKTLGASNPLPLAEQYRILARVDKPTALCDGIKATRNKRGYRRNHIVTAKQNRHRFLDALLEEVLETHDA